jgi:hypothetical protein
MTPQYGAYALHAGLARLYARTRMHTPTRPGAHMHTRARKHARTYQYVTLLLFHSNNDFANTPQCYVIRTLPLLFVMVETAAPTISGTSPCHARKKRELTTEKISVCGTRNVSDSDSNSVFRNYV